MTSSNGNGQSPRNGPYLDWSAGSGGPGWTTAVGTVSTGVFGVAAALGDMAPWWATAAGTVLGAVSAGVAWMDGDPVRDRVLRLSKWTCSGSWIAYAATGDAWRHGWAPWVTLGVGGLVVGALASAFERRRPAGPADRAQVRAAVSVSVSGLVEEWRERLRVVCRVALPPGAIRVVLWANGYGYDVHADLSSTRYTWRGLKPHEDALAGNARLDNGGGVEVTAGAHRGAAILRVCARDAMAEERLYPLDDLAEVRTINDPVRFGFHRDGSRAEAVIRYARVILCGPQDAGKSNELQVLNAEINKCGDALIRIIDLSGGSLAWPWIRPWVEGRASKPGVDWIAPTAEEAVLLMEDTVGESKRRKRDLQHLMIDDDKIAVSAEVPEIFVVIDEGAEVSGQANSSAAKKAKALIDELRRIGRSAGINVIQCSLRPTSDMTGGAAVKKLSGIRALMTSPDAKEEGAALFGGGKYLPEDAPYVGCGWLARERVSEGRPFRGERITPAIIDALTVATADRRPEPYSSPNYAGRWERIGITPPSAATAAAPDPAAGRTATATAERPAGGDRPERETGDIGDRLAELQRRRAERKTFDRIADLFDTTEAPDPTPRPDWRTRLVELLRAAGEEGLSVRGAVAALNGEGYSIGKTVVHEWLQKNARSGPTGYTLRPDT
ncbi:hypothetical protein [Cryptosporangium aurantiacum]|uniref:FtsK domain-containing protein n=1 Tax=Cryptosporangium aurantiacum TaxID=134849 RepID=A0A1M7RK53_9ACTN|nr:hypothetical protein [Cryptosporangium aurantiacum]SHN46448.1 hypothetical protein SAMN05443668_115137 [Cryptosporangium aurantiacum]